VLFYSCLKCQPKPFQAIATLLKQLPTPCDVYVRSVVVDPVEPQKVLAAAARIGKEKGIDIKITHVLTTHKHW